MPSFGKVTRTQWAQMYASTSVFTYEVFDRLKNGPASLSDFTEIKATTLMLEADWIKLEDGLYSITESGQKHLDSFNR